MLSFNSEAPLFGSLVSSEYYLFLFYVYDVKGPNFLVVSFYALLLIAKNIYVE